MHDTPKTTQEAVELGLYLAITADTEEKSKEALELARRLSYQITYGECEIAKINVRRYIERERAVGAEYPQSPPRMAVPIKRAMKPKRLTRDLILDAIGHPNLIMKRVVHRFENSGHKIGWKFVYLHHDPLTSIMPKSVGELHVDHRKLNDLTLEQWVENGQKLVDQVENA